MAKIKLTKGELKRQRDALRQYERYLPTLQLKKQQLQAEIINQVRLSEERQRAEEEKRRDIEKWAGLLSDEGVDIRPRLKIKGISSGTKNVAGVDVSLFEQAEFDDAAYDLYLTPLWTDAAIENFRALVSARKEIELIKANIAVLRIELRTTAQRVNLFEKVKIPDAKEAIRRIKIYIGDQMVNDVGRSKIAKRKIEIAELEEALA